MDINLAWFPLVPRPRPPGSPLDTRVEELTALTVGTEQGTGQERATRAAEVLNKAALIASDCGVPGLARQLCHRQYALLAQSAPLPAWAVRLALQPVLNVPRQLIREGRADEAHTMLETLHRAALNRAAADIEGRPIDFGTLTDRAEAHKEARTLTWTALLADGTRALAQAGHWTEAADLAAAHRGIGTRLLDGRQTAILARLHDGHADQAAEMVEESEASESWENAVQSILRVLCRRATSSITGADTATMLALALATARLPDCSTTVGRTRIGIIAIDLAGTVDAGQTESLRTALAATTMHDAYAARDLLSSQHAHEHLTARQLSDLRGLVGAGGLGSGTIPGRLCPQVMAAVIQAEAMLAFQPVHNIRIRGRPPIR
jgi:hypothetical protein